MNMLSTMVLLSFILPIGEILVSCDGKATATSTSTDAPAVSNLSVNHVSVGGGSQCITGDITLTVTVQNLRINYTQPSNELAATEFIVEYLQPNSTLAQQVVGGPHAITGTYRIHSSLCLPSKTSATRNGKTVQFLTHGDTLSSSYWDIAPGYSYIDAVTAAGYAAFSYDRIGVGKSDHPDPIQVVQGPLQVEIAHALVQLLRSGIDQYKFSKVVGVGHSAGSAVTQGVTTKYPKDFDAIILTGTSTIATYVPLTVAAFDFQIANQASPRFSSLPNGYFTQASARGIQFSFFRFPNFDPTS